MNLKLVRSPRVSLFRKIAIGTWRTAYDPSVYGTIELRMDEALEYLEAFRACTGQKATVTHLVAKATAAALRETPDANAVLRWGRSYLRQDVGVFFQVAITDDGAKESDLSGFVVHHVDRKSLKEICEEFARAVEKVRARADLALEKTRQMMCRMPGLLTHWALRLSSFVAYVLNLDPRFLGVPKDAFGSVMVTNVGSLGLDIAYPPLVPYSRVPLLLAIGEVKERAVVERGAVVVGKVMNLSVTFDHRLIDGMHAALMARTLRRWIERPFEHFDRLDLPVGARASEGEHTIS
jgi:pyruvate/2-oxoglutarate dehydrogenase complex dihydrolipoamide acyltransferase (E2) component